MLFPTVDQQISRIIISIILGLVITAVATVFIGVSRATELAAIASTATPTKTPTRIATATPIPTSTNTPTPTPTFTNTPTQTPTPTTTSTNTSTSTATLIPPTSTFTPTALPIITDTLEISIVATVELTSSTVEVVSNEIPADPVITPSLALSQTGFLTNSLPIEPVGTPTPTPTPIPRTLQVPTDLTDYREASEHFWFTRPLTEAYHSWGSYYYPYGTNARGQYFWHHGIDIQASQGTPIVAIGDGTVLHAAPDISKQLGPWPNFYGQAVMIEHDRLWDGLPVYTLYGHVSEVLVQPGQQIKAGDLIARAGQLGVALGPHLHLEIRVGAGTYSDTRNPDLWVRPDPGFGVIAGRVVDYQNYYVPQQLVTLHRFNEPGRFWRQTYTYPDNIVNSDDKYGETFTFSDVPAGDYLVKTFFDGQQITIPVTINNQEVTFVLLNQDQPPPPPQLPTPTSTLSSIEVLPSPAQPPDEER